MTGSVDAPADDVVGGPIGDAVHHHGFRSGRTLAGRLILLTTLVVGLAVAFVALGAYVTVRAQLQSELDQSLFLRAEALATDPEIVPRLSDAGSADQGALLGAGDVRLFLISPNMVVPAAALDKPGPLPGAPEASVAKGITRDSARTIEAGGGGGTYRMVAVQTAPNQALVLAQSLGPEEGTLHRFGLVMFLFGLVGVLAAAMAGWGVARSGLRPVRTLTGAVERIARTEDLTPLPVEGDDEIARLATSFNAMLASLSASRERQKQLVADAGHELRTPLTSLRTNIDLLTMSDEPGGHTLPEEARTELLDDVRAQIEELSTLVGDLVELARDDPAASVIDQVELHETLDQAVTRVRRRAPSVTFEVDADPWYVVGDSSGLERALTNLLDNAAKWSPAGGTVRVTLKAGIFTVEDQGPGIPESDLPLIFDRFYRSTESRTMPGSGLGLSIVAQVALRHSGSVRAERAPSGGARLVLQIPGAPARMTVALADA